MALAGVAHSHTGVFLNLQCQGLACPRQGVISNLLATCRDKKRKHHVQQVEENQNDRDDHADPADSHPVACQFVLEHPPAVAWA